MKYRLILLTLLMAVPVWASTERPYFAELGMTTGWSFQHQFTLAQVVPETYTSSGAGANLQTSVGAYFSSLGLSAEIRLPAFFSGMVLPYNYYGMFARWKLGEHWIARVGPFYCVSRSAFYVADAWSVRGGIQYVSNSSSFFYLSASADYEYLRAPEKAASATAGSTQALESTGIILMLSLGMRTSLKP